MNFKSVQTIMTTPVIVGLLFIAVIALGVYELSNSQPTSQESEIAEPIVIGLLPEEVMLINGVVVEKQVLLDNITRTEAIVVEQGRDITDPAIQIQIQDRAIEQTINNELLIQAATEAGVEVAEADIASALAEIEGEFSSEEEFVAQLKTLEVTREQLIKTITDQLAIVAYLENSEAVISLPRISQAEAQQFYADLQAQNTTELPAFADIEVDIKNQLQQQARDIAIAEHIAELRNSADIEVWF